MLLHVFLALLICTSAASAQDKFAISKMSLPKGTHESVLLADGYQMRTVARFYSEFSVIIDWESGKSDTIDLAEQIFDVAQTSATTDTLATINRDWMRRYVVDRLTQRVTLLDSIRLPTYRKSLKGIRGGGKYLLMDSLFEYEPKSGSWILNHGIKYLDIQTDLQGNEWALHSTTLWVRWNGVGNWEMVYNSLALNKPWNLTHMMYVGTDGKVWVKRDSLKCYDPEPGKWIPVPEGLPDTLYDQNGSRLTSITQDDEGNLFLAGYGGVFRSDHSTQRFEQVALSLDDSFANTSFYREGRFRELARKSLRGSYTLTIGTEAGLFVSSDNGTTWIYTPRTEANAREILIDDRGTTVCTPIGIYRKQTGADWVKVFPATGFRSVSMYASPDLQVIYIVDGGSTHYRDRNVLSWVTLDTFKSFILDTIGNWRHGFDEVFVDKDHIVHSLDPRFDSQLLTKRLLEDWSADVGGPLMGGSHLHLTSKMGSFATWWSSDEERASISFREDANAPWKVIFERTGNPAKIVGVGHGNSKPAVIADRTSAYEFDGIGVRELISPPEFDNWNSSLKSVAVSITDDVWLVGCDLDTQLFIYSADRVKWHELRSSRWMPYYSIRASGDSALLLTNEGIFVLKLADPKSRVNAQGQAQCRVTPNPAKDQITVSGILGAWPTARISLFESTGKLVRTVTTEVTQGSAQITLAGLAAGSYLLNVESGEQSFSSKFILEP